LDSIFLTLEFQKHSLVSIEFLFICFSNISIKNFINLHKLNHLKFEGCKDKKPLDRYEILQFASFKLKKLEFINNTWNEIIEPTIIKYLGASLQYLEIYDPLRIPMIKNVSMHCLNLITLELSTYYFNNTDLLVFLILKI
jgi:hypothetical protein